jgi:hypothetical protein
LNFFGGRKIMKRKLFGIILLLAAFGLFSTPSASALLFDLNYVINDGMASPSTVGSFGTIGITDGPGNAVTVNVDLVDTPVGADPHRVQRVYLNYDAELLGGASFNPFTSPSIAASTDSIGSPGGYVNAWDLQVPATRNLGFEPVSFLIIVPEFTLIEDYFNHTDARGGGLYAGVHIGNYGGIPGTPGGGSITVGAGPSTPVPEPATMLLLGAGLVSISSIGMRRRMKK